MSASEQKQTAGPVLDCLVYVAEDDPYLRELAGLLLESEHIPHRTFCNGEEALKDYATAEKKPGLVISDFSMGMYNMNGVQFLAAVKNLNPATKCFLVSGTVDRASVAVDGKPVDRYLSKPYDNSEFLNVARSLLGLPPSPVVQRPASSEPDDAPPAGSLQ